VFKNTTAVKSKSIPVDTQRLKNGTAAGGELSERFLNMGGTGQRESWRGVI